MRSLVRPSTPSDVAAASLAAARTSSPPIDWETFKKQQSDGWEALKGDVFAISASICGWCGGRTALHVDHRIPKDGRVSAPSGVSTEDQPGQHQTFRWENLLPSCDTCNGVQFKGSKIAWSASGRAMWLDPAGEDIGAMLTLATEVDPSSVDYGWLEARPKVSQEDHDRVEWTLDKLGLNRRTDARRDRGDAWDAFDLRALAALHLGADHRLKAEGPTVGEWLLDRATVGSLHLLVVRCWIMAYPDLATRLFNVVAGLRDRVARWWAGVPG